MKRIFIISIAILFLGIGIVYAYATSQKRYVPVIVERTTLENSIATISSQKVQNPGKIFVKDSLLFVIEQYYGVHIFDNSDPAHPKKMEFIRVLGCTDVAVKGQLMYASSGVDLVTINITDISNATEIAREKNVLSEIRSPYGIIDDKYSKQNRPENTVIIAWKTE
ncbi:MAG: hypothetical protein R6U95_02960 [Bacteroidales bacterium]